MESKFTGGAWGILGVGIVSILLLFIPFVGGSMSVCYKNRYYASRTIIDGKQLKFVGLWGDIFVKRLIWSLLTMVTVGIYLFFYKRNMQRFIVANTHVA